MSARFLSEAERIAIADGLFRGESIRVIAAELGRAPSTVSRKTRRNRDIRTEVYQPFRAQRRAAGPGSGRNSGSSFAAQSCGRSSRATSTSAGARSSVEEVELATADWVFFWNFRRLHSATGYLPPAEFERAYYRRQAEPLEAA